MKNVFFAWVYFICIVTSYKAQFSVYSFTQTIGTYSAISGGTLYGNQTTDDEVFVNTAAPLGNGLGTSGPGLPIGFNFLVNGNIYDRIGINANGFIMLGQTSATPAVVSQLSNQYAPISSTSNAISNLQHKVVAFGCDLEAQSTLSEIRKETIGTSPNRTMVVQWTDYRKYNNTGDNFNFQIRLVETSNVIEIIYGVFVNNTTTGIAQVGLRGAVPTDFSNRYVNALNTWSVSAAGVTNTTIANFNSALLPPSGLIYRWSPPPPCTTTPASNTVQASVVTICPGGSSTLSLVNTYSLTGITINWLASTTSSTGPYTQIPGAGGSIYYANNVSTSTWYQCAIACVNGGASTYSTPKQIVTTAGIISQVPYHENFESILTNNQLPNCSWAASSPSVICQTYTSAATNNRVANSGNKFAAFRYGTNPNGDLFYSNGMQLYTGITYSASAWYITDGNPGWTEFSILRGVSQTSTNLTMIATVTSAINSINNVVYTPVGNTFTVPTSGIYYLAIRCKGTNAPQYLSFDDLSVTVPCSYNTPALNLNASADTVCEGQSVTITVTGLDTYTWSTGATTPGFSITPGTSGGYTVIGTSTLTGCTNTASTYITVNQAPLVTIYTPSMVICTGHSLNLIAVGATSYTWNTGSTSQNISITPSTTSIYSVLGNYSNGCSSAATLQVLVNTSPTITAQASPAMICAGEAATLSAGGAGSYLWKAPTLYFQGNNVSVSPIVPTIYSVTGTASNGCTGQSTVTLFVALCPGFAEVAPGGGEWKIYPVPCRETLNIDYTGDAGGELLVTDMAGRVLIREKLKNGKEALDIGELEPGLYHISIGKQKAKYFTRLPD